MPDQVTRSIIVGAPVATVFHLWSRVESFPRFMKHVRSVTRTGADTQHWVVEGPLGKDLEWDARVTRFEENTRIAWTTLPDNSTRTSGQVTFTALPDDQTQVTITLQYVAPGGAAGQALAKVLTDAGERVDEELRRFKAHAEGRDVAEAGAR